MVKNDKWIVICVKVHPLAGGVPRCKPSGSLHVVSAVWDRSSDARHTAVLVVILLEGIFSSEARSPTPLFVVRG